ncbi:MAG: thiamine-phosphate kinase [Thiotrichales bacterium]|nr:thiamine-phosphate kinase [Thiotrichales bacterium]
MPQEFTLIDQYFLPLSKGLLPNELGIGDDGAVMTPPDNHQLVVVTDTLVAGVHFPLDTAPADIAWKAVAVNLSDLAAMGAKPGFISLALTLPENEQAWLNGFAKGLTDICHHYQVPLIGGDTTKGPLTITVTAHGWVERGGALYRSGAQVGDIIAVSGVIGDAGLGLKFALNTLTKSQQACLNSEDIQFCLDALNRPNPQLGLGRLLQSHATSAIDISDGLLADFTHILEQSIKHLERQGLTLGAEIYLESLPLSPAMQKWIQHTNEWTLPLSAGDDYQLCFTVRPEHWINLHKLAKAQGFKITQVGRITGQAGVVVKANADSEDVITNLLTSGYQHF